MFFRRTLQYFQRGLKQSAEDIGSALPPLVMRAEQVADLVSLGFHGRRKPGMGESFWNFRPYTFTDPATLIDWRKSGKTEQFFVREKESEISHSVWLWRDNSASMHFSSDTRLPTKIQMANLLILALAALLTRGGERYSFLGANLPLSSGRVAIRRIAQLVDSRQGEEANIQTDSIPPRITLPPRAELILITDGLGTPEEWRMFVDFYKAQNVRGHIIHIVDPAETDLSFTGALKIRDAESGETILFREVESLRKDYQKAWQQHTGSLAAIFRDAGWSFISFDTARPPEQMLYKLFTYISEKGGA